MLLMTYIDLTIPERSGGEEESDEKETGACIIGDVTVYWRLLSACGAAACPNGGA
jgi:hypothetical protein